MGDTSVIADPILNGAYDPPERHFENTLVNDIRGQVEPWRGQRYQGVTPYSRKLFEHWADETREDRVLFCQREAAETSIFLAEVAGRHGYPDFRPPPRRGRLGLAVPDRVRPFHRPESGKIAVKVINDYGDEVMKVFEHDSAGRPLTQ